MASKRMAIIFLDALKKEYALGTELSTREIIDCIRRHYDVLEGNIKPPDYCDNHKNEDPTTGIYHLFHRVDRNRYIFIGNIDAEADSHNFIRSPSLHEWKDYKFPDAYKAVYVICVGGVIPFYVGSTKEFRRRMGDYSIGSFQASTDFKVRYAMEYLESQGETVIVKHYETEKYLELENKLIRILKDNGAILLNDLKGYDYKKADRDAELSRIHSFTAGLLRKAKDENYALNCTNLWKQHIEARI